MATAIAILAGATGAMAATLQEQQVAAHENEYGVSFSGVANFPNAPTLGASAVGSGTSTCDRSYSGSSGATYYPGTAATLNVGIGPNGTCKGGDFAETLAFAAASSVSGEVDTFTFVASWTASNGSSEATSTAMSVDVVSGSTGGTGVTFVLDLGASGPPQAVTGLSVVVT